LIHLFVDKFRAVIYTHPTAQAPLPGGGGGGGAGGEPLYKLYRCVPPKWVGFLRRFGLKTVIHFAHFGLESGMVFEGATGVSQRIKIMSKKEREICEFEMDWKNVFVCAPI